MSLQGLTMDNLRLSVGGGGGSPPNVVGAPHVAAPGAQPTQPQPPPHQANQPQQQQAFGAVVPGRPVRTDFAPVDATGLKFALNLSCPGDLQAPLASVQQIVFFLLPGVQLPPDHGVLCYVQLTAAPAVEGAPPTSTGFELLGGITSEQPSSAFRTGWGEKEDLLSLSTQGIPVTITIAASIEPLANLQNLGVLQNDGTTSNSGRAGGSSNEKRLMVAQQIAYDLFHFMQSFDTGNGGPGNMVVPQNIFDRWFKRFENRFKRDPNFFMKNRDER